MATFPTGSAAGLDLDGTLGFLEVRDKVRITNGVVFPGGSPPSWGNGQNSSP